MSALPFGQALARVIECLQRLRVPYFVGGSVASTVHGEIRTTHDVDVVVDLLPGQIEPLVVCLAPEFFVDIEHLRVAVARRSCCNVIHRETGFKVDLFQLRNREFSRIEMQRSRPIELLPGVAANIASAEDCVLTKLEWFEKGGQVSDRQWRDVLGVLRGGGAPLDRAYLRLWSRSLAIEGLLDRALREAGLPPG